MTRTRVRRVLLGCVASNMLIGGIGLAATADAPRAVLAAAPVASAGAPESTTTLDPTTSGPSTTAPVVTTAPSVPTTPKASPVASRSSRNKTPSTTAAVAAGDAPGIASPAAPSGTSWSAPAPGSYAATFSGSASANGSAEAVPSTGAIVLKASGTDISQSSPKIPGDVVLTQRFSSAKTDLVSFQLNASSVHKTFNPASPVTFTRFDAPSGTSWAWTATSTDGKTHVSASGSVAGADTFNVAGQDVATIRIETTFTISGDIKGTAKLTSWVSPANRLPVVQREVINAKMTMAYGFSSSFVSDITSTLTSLSHA